MKRFWIAGAFALSIGGPALAADLPPPPGPMPRAPATYVPAAVPYYNWGGIYVGINAGAAFGTSRRPAPAYRASATTGFLVGPTVGFNYQVGSFVFGVGRRLGLFDIRAALLPWRRAPSRAPGSLPRAAASAMRGIASCCLPPAAALSQQRADSGRQARTALGWTGGGGIEFAFAQNWTAKAEYLLRLISRPSIGLAGVNSKATENVVRAGVNYKFNF